MIQNKLVVGNLKMHLAQLEERHLYVIQMQDVLGELSLDLRAQAVLCPPTLFLSEFVQQFSSLSVGLGAQNCFWENEGKYTGETSPQALAACGARYVIIGHSERRGLGENNDDVLHKVEGAIAAGLIPIVCVGFVEEEKTERESVKTQVAAVMRGIAGNDCTKIIVAYEPVWAIGSGETPTKEAIDEMAMYIRTCADHAQLKVLYGGSVIAENVGEICTGKEIDGVLVGGASLKPEEFVNIIKNANT